MKSAWDVLHERGFIEQVTHEEIKDALESGCVTFYTGFDPTADSLHAGHFIPVMAMAHLQRAGHRPIALVGGGTAMVGDPSGRADLRQVLTKEKIVENSNALKKQLSRFLDFSEGKAVMVNNADWILGLNYIDFLRDIGSLFSVNRMLTAECFKSRMEKGLTFIEFNYMLMQAYDFLVLYQQYGCTLQVGGNDQWSNILAGADLIRRKERADAFGLTVALLTNSQGQKMGKTAAGALWLDENKTSPYDFFQYWRNVEDADVKKCLSMLTFLPMEEVNRLSALKDAEINEAKEVLAYEITKLIHGEQEAKKAKQAAKALFAGGVEGGSIPTTAFAKSDFVAMGILDLAVAVGLCSSKGDARRTIDGGGLYIEDEKVSGIDYQIDLDSYTGGSFLMRKGRKQFHRVVIK